ncbi:MAG: TolC family protein, partial [Tannerella sp.]|nr:TolC family protein [Tannerella sp.]
MKIKSILFTVALICTTGISAQTGGIQSVLEQIEANSPELAALKKQAEAVKAGSRTGIYLPDPAVEFNFLWGTPASMGNRTDLNVMQSFDFPTAYYYKRKIAAGKATQADLQYAVERKALLLQARRTCIELVYRNALQAELDRRLLHAGRIADACRAKFDKGETDILEQNRAQLNLLNVRKEAGQNAIERETLSAELARLNGGNAVVLDDAAFDAVLLPADFEEWYARAESANPALQQLSQEIEISRRQVQLDKARWLPGFSAGYRSERIAGTTLQGIGVGISIPLWEKRHTVKAAKAQTAALQSSETAARAQFYSTLEIQFAKAQSLRRLTDDYKQSLRAVSSVELLQTALDKGQISLIEYIMEQTVYYEAAGR